MSSAGRERAQREMYLRLKAMRPDIYNKAVEIGSLASIGGASLKLSAEIEGAVVSLALSIIDENDRPHLAEDDGDDE